MSARPKRRVAGFEPRRRPERPRIGLVQRLGHNERTVPYGDDVVREMLARIAPEELTAIPELGWFYERLARFLGVERDRVLACHGADAGIALLFEAYVGAGDDVVQIHPTYHRYTELCDLHGARSVRIAYDAELRLDFDALLDAISPTTKLVVLANPNSPTGTHVELEQLAAAAERARRHDALLLVDEVYFHYCEITAIPLLAELDNVVVARSFSKAFGLAGVRVGAMVAHPDVIHQLWKLKPRHEISAVSARLVEYLLDHPELVEEYVAASLESRGRLADALRPLGFTVVPSRSAGVMILTPDDVDGVELAARLWDAGYEIGAGFPAPYDRYVRVAAGPREQMEEFAEVVRRTTEAMRVAAPAR